MISIKMKSIISMMYNKRLSLELDQLFTYFTTEHEYNLFCEFMVNYVLDDYSRANDTVEIICSPTDSKKKTKDVIYMTLFQLIINFYFLELNFEFHIEITKDWLWNIDVEFLKNLDSHIEDFCQTKLYPMSLKKKLDPEMVFSHFLPNFTERMEKLSELMSPIAAPTLCILDIINFCKRNSEFNNLLNTTLDEHKSIQELERQLKRDGKRLMDVIMADGKSCLYPFIQADCLHDTQVTQMFVAVGPRMTVSNVVMPHIMTRSYLNGLQNAGDLIAEAEIANKALIYKKKYVGVSGYMSRETGLLCSGLRVDYDCPDCGTKHYIDYDIKSDKHLKLIVSKNIILPNGKLHEVTKDDTNLIGTVVKLRSITTCAHTKPGCVCKACYGNPMSFKKNYRIGNAVSTEIDNKLSNAVMSVKHQTSTNTTEFNNEELLKLFNLDDSKLFLKKLENAEDISLIFNKDYIEDIIERINNDEDESDDDEVDEETEDDEDSEIKNISSKMINNLRISTKKIDPVTGEEILDEYEVVIDGSFLTLSEDMMNINMLKNINIPMDSDSAILNLSDIKAGTQIFNIKYITKETSKYLKDLKKIIERPKPEWYVNDLNTPINTFADLVISAGLKNSEMVFLEPVIYSLTRDSNNILKRPDFSKANPTFVVGNLKTGIFKGDLFTTFIYQEITKTFKDIDSFEKEGEGVHDSEFQSSVKYNFNYMEKALKKAKII